MGHPFGQLNLGNSYVTGRGVSLNLATARSWYQKAAEKGDAQAMRKLGCMKITGKGGAMDLNGGIDLWKKAAANAQARRHDGQGLWKKAAKR